MRLLVSFARQYPLQCTVVFFCLLFAAIGEGIGLTTLLPLLTLATEGNAGIGHSHAGRLLTDMLQRVHLQPTLATLVLVIIAGLILKATLTLLAYRQAGYTVANIATDLRLALLRALSLSRWEYFLRQRSGGLANAVATEATRSAAAFQSGTAVVALLTQSLIFLCVALLVNWQVALGALMLGVFIFFAMRRFVRTARRAGSRQSTLFKSLLSLLTDSLRSLKPLKAMAREAEIDHLLERDTHDLNRAMRKEVLSREGLKAVQELLIGIVLVLGIYMLLQYWNMQLPTVMTLTVVLARLLTMLSKTQQEYQKLVASESFYWALQDSIAEARKAQEIPFGNKQPTLQSGIRLQNLGFSYAGQHVLKGLDIEIPSGRFTALIGPSGAGKTTIVDLVIGLLRTSEGTVLIDGVPIEEIDIRRWRGMIGYVPQETVLLHDSILNNVTIGDTSLTEADAVWALQQAGAWKFVEQHAEGLHAVVGEHGGRLSGGQRQRIVLARALAHRPRLLILDEATSALDPDTELSVSRTLRELGPDYTILAISHRSTMMELADRVYRVHDGRATLVEPALG